MRRFPNWLAVAACLITPFLLVSCAPQDVNELRGSYTAELRGWIAKEQPAAVVDEVQTVSDQETEDEAGAQEEAAEDEVKVSQVPASKDVLLDIVLRHEGAGKLPGITLDVYQLETAPEEGEQVDPTDSPKDHWRIYVDTSDLVLEKRVTHTLEDVDVEDDDGFALMIRSSVPPEEQSEYKEFAQVESY